MAEHEQTQFTCYFQNWMDQQEQEITQLTHEINQDVEDKVKLCHLVETCVKHYEEYNEKRLVLARSNPCSFFSPTWCSSFENTYLWIGGCRPTVLIQLIYTLSGIDIESQLDEFLQGVRKGNLGELSAAQLGLVNDLQLNTIRDEDKMSSRMATMQEEMGHKTLVQMASELTQYCESNSDLHQALDSHEVALVSILEGADKLRLNTMKELVHILTTTQTVEFLLAGKKLQLSIHECCKTRTH